MRTAWDRIKPILELLARSMESDGPVRLAVVLCRPGPVPGSRGKVEVEADWHAMSVTGSDWLAAVPSRMVVEDGSSGGGGTAGFPLARGLFVALESIVADRGTSPSTSAEPGCRDHVIVAFAGRSSDSRDMLHTHSGPTMASAHHVAGALGQSRVSLSFVWAPSYRHFDSGALEAFRAGFQELAGHLKESFGEEWLLRRTHEVKDVLSWHGPTLRKYGHFLVLSTGRSGQGKAAVLPSGACERPFQLVYKQYVNLIAIPLQEALEKQKEAERQRLRAEEQRRLEAEAASRRLAAQPSVVQYGVTYAQDAMQHQQQHLQAVSGAQATLVAQAQAAARPAPAAQSSPSAWLNCQIVIHGLFHSPLPTQIVGTLTHAPPQPRLANVAGVCNAFSVLLSAVYNDLAVHGVYEYRLGIQLGIPGMTPAVETALKAAAYQGGAIMPSHRAFISVLGHNHVLLFLIQDFRSGFSAGFAKIYIPEAVPLSVRQLISAMSQQTAATLRA